MRGVSTGYGIGASFLMDLNLLSHYKLFKALCLDCTVLYNMGQHAHFLCARDRVQGRPIGPGLGNETK